MSLKEFIELTKPDDLVNVVQDLHIHFQQRQNNFDS
jgi:hypothetical protein